MGVIVLTCVLAVAYAITKATERNRAAELTWRCDERYGWGAWYHECTLPSMMVGCKCRERRVTAPPDRP